MALDGIRQQHDALRLSFKKRTANGSKNTEAAHLELDCGRA